MKTPPFFSDRLSHQTSPSHRNQPRIGRSFLGSLFAAALLLTPVVSNGAPVINGTVFDIDFESPNYTLGNSYVASTETDTGMTGSAPSKITGFSNFGTNSNWVASIQSLSGSNQMNFTIDAGAQFDGRFEAFAGSQLGSDTSTWGFSADFTSYSATGANLFNQIHMVSGDGNGLGSLVSIHDTSINGNLSSVALTLGQSYALRYEADMGTDISGNVRFYVNDVQISAIQSNLTAGNGKDSVGGLQINFANNSNAAERQFSFDNIVVGQAVPEPSTLLLGLFGFALLLRRRLAARHS